MQRHGRMEHAFGGTWELREEQWEMWVKTGLGGGRSFIPQLLFEHLLCSKQY